MFIELYSKQILSRTGVKLHKNATISISFALKLFLKLLILLKIYRISNFSEYKTNVPIIIDETPKYWMLLSFSPKITKEKIELNKGENESRGMVKLKSESLIDFKNSRAEIIPIITKENPEKK